MRFPYPRSYLPANLTPIDTRIDAGSAWRAAERLCALDKGTTRLGPLADTPAPRPVDVFLAWCEDGLVKLDERSLSMLPSSVRRSL